MEQEAKKTSGESGGESIELKPHEDYIKVISELVPDPFIVCLKRETAKAVRAKFKGMVIYTPNEMRILESANPDKNLLNKIHITKKVFPGARIYNLVRQAQRGGHEK